MQKLRVIMNKPFHNEEKNVRNNGGERNVNEKKKLLARKNNGFHCNGSISITHLSINFHDTFSLQFDTNQLRKEK